MSKITIYVKGLLLQTIEEQIKDLEDKYMGVKMPAKQLKQLKKWQAAHQEVSNELKTLALAQ